MAWNDLDADMDLAEAFVAHLVRQVLERNRAELELLERDTAPLERCVPRNNFV